MGFASFCLPLSPGSHPSSAPFLRGRRAAGVQRGGPPLPYGSRMPPKGAALTQSPIFLPVPQNPHLSWAFVPSQRLFHAGGPAPAPAPKDCPFSSPYTQLTAPGINPGVLEAENSALPYPKHCPKVRWHTMAFCPRSLPHLEPSFALHRPFPPCQHTMETTTTLPPKKPQQISGGFQGI